MDNIKENVNRVLMKELGITYDEYERLDIYDQQNIMKHLREKRKKNKKLKDNQELIMIGYGEYSFVTKIERGTKVMTRYGETVEAGLTPEESEERLNKRVEEVIEEKPKSKILKLFRRK